MCGVALNIGIAFTSFLRICGVLPKRSAQPLFFLLQVDTSGHIFLQAESKGVSLVIQGWIFGVFALAQCLVSPLFGKLVKSKFL